MKQIKLFLGMLLAAMSLPTAVFAQDFTITSTFTNLSGLSDREGTVTVWGSLQTEEDKNWKFTCSDRWIYPKQTTVDDVFAITLSESTTFYSTFTMREYILKVTVRAGGNLSKIAAYISGVSLAKCDLGTIDVTSSDVQDYVFTVDPSAGETALAADGRPVYVVLTPGSGSGATAIESIKIESSLNPPSDNTSETSGMTGDLLWEVEKLDYTVPVWEVSGLEDKPAYRLLVSGTGSMPDYMEKYDAKTSSWICETPWKAFATITEVRIGEGVENIGNYAFFEFRFLKSVVLPPTIKKIGTLSFMSSGLESIKFPSRLETIGVAAFQNCRNLTSVNLPGALKELDVTSFKNNYLEKITVSEGNEKFDSRDECNAVILKADNELFIGTPATVIPVTVTSIGESAFYNLNGLTSLVIPDNVMSIGKEAFSACYGLETLTIGSGVTSIGEKAFKNCAKMADVLCMADPEKLTWEGNDDASCCKSDGSTKFHVADPNAWKAKFPDAHVQFVAIGSAETKDGDVSGDGKTDDKDVTALMSYLMGSAPEGFTPEAADVNGDHKVDVADIVALIKIILKK